MLTLTLILIFFAFSALLIAAAMQPDEFVVSRSILIRASPAAVFPHLNSHRKMAVWSPWVKLDPTADYAYAGPESGVGAISRWNGNRRVGKGMSTITESRNDSFVRCRLDFEKPMKVTNTADFDLSPQGGDTEVSWSMRGRNNFLSKLMSLIINCEKMVGSKFEEGLASLKSHVEGAPR